MTELTARQALEIWYRAKLLTEQQTAELAAHLDREEATPRQSRAITIFASIGAILVGLGIVLFIGSHWGRMGPLARMLVLTCVYGLSVAGAAFAEARNHERLARALWFLVTLGFGANIFFFGQIFNFTLTYWQGTLVWLIGTLAMGFAIDSRLHAWMAIPLAILTLGWLGGGSGWFFDDQFEFLWSKNGLRPLVAVLGLGFVALGTLARQTPWRFAGGVWLSWGGWLVVIPLALSTADPWLFKFLFDTGFAPVQVGILVGTGILVCAALGFGRCTPQSRLLLAGLTGLAFLLVIPGEAHSPWLALHLKQWPIHALYIILVFGLGLLTVWAGLKASDSRLVNVGIAGAAVVVLCQYFSWSFRLLDRSAAFIVGGLVLIGLSILIERKRRQLLMEIRR